MSAKVARHRGVLVVKARSRHLTDTRGPTVPPMAVFEFLHRVIDVFEDYFGDFSQDTALKNAVIVYEVRGLERVAFPRNGPGYGGVFGVYCLRGVITTAAFLLLPGFRSKNGGRRAMDNNVVILQEKHSYLLISN